MNPAVEQALKQARILVVDDVQANVELLCSLLRMHGYMDVHATTDSRQALAMHEAQAFDLILLDLQMPHLDGIAILRALRAAAGGEFLPVIVVTAFSDEERRMQALQQGARDYILKPFLIPEVLLRIRNFLEVQMLYRERRRQTELLEQRVTEQVGQLERLARLKRFFSPHLAERIVAGGVDDPLRTHRREIAAVSIDLRGFTAFTESAEPEEVMAILHAYHAEIGRIILRHEGTIEYFAGDGIMVFFNDPVPVPNPAERAARMALEMQDEFSRLSAGWRREGVELGLGIGIALGFATIGAIGFEGRWDYGAVGSVTNLAARLCAEAQPGEILTHKKVTARLDPSIEVVAARELALKGFSQPVAAFNVAGLSASAVQAA